MIVDNVVICFGGLAQGGLSEHCSSGSEGTGLSEREPRDSDDSKMLSTTRWGGKEWSRQEGEPGCAGVYVAAGKHL